MSRRPIEQVKQKLDKKGGNRCLTGEKSEAFRDTPIWHGCEPVHLEELENERKKSPALEPAKRQYSLAIASLVRVEGLNINCILLMYEFILVENMRTDRWRVTSESPVKIGETLVEAQVRGLRIEAIAQHPQFTGLCGS
ncbi:hypothetical protein HAX54_018800 [Datura stramonium]|uniref:Uncharacterized protein n=1 Tax=Datura stramonium TaxID=4076 RepID=A0ABS8UN51_DATST|nr:hypothetical protein [Datura stramonium]